MNAETEYSCRNCYYWSMEIDGKEKYKGCLMFEPNYKEDHAYIDSQDKKSFLVTHEDFYCAAFEENDEEEAENEEDEIKELEY